MKQQTLDFEKLAEKFKAIGHPVRVAMFQLLCHCPEEGLSVKGMYQTLGLDQPTASRHLAVMRNSGVVRRRTERGNTFYCLCLTDPDISCLSGCFTNSKYKIE